MDDSRPLNILLIEPHAAVRRVTVQWIEATGHNLIAVSSLEELDDSIQNAAKDLDLLIVDVPAWQPSNCLARTAELAERFKIAKVLYTSVLSFDRDEFKDLPPSQYLNKPYKRLSLLNKLREVCG